LIERRLIGRTKISKSALLFCGEQLGVFGCGVRDITNIGAGLRLDGLDVHPVDFELSFDNFRTVRKCRVAWKQGDFVGVEFMPAV
jgi:hypothetical protein